MQRIDLKGLTLFRFGFRHKKNVTVKLNQITGSLQRVLKTNWSGLIRVLKTLVKSARVNQVW